jgi:hypothetical protein
MNNASSPKRTAEGPKCSPVRRLGIHFQGSTVPGTEDWFTGMFNGQTMNNLKGNVQFWVKKNRWRRQTSWITQNMATVNRVFGRSPTKSFGKSSWKWVLILHGTNKYEKKYLCLKPRNRIICNNCLRLWHKSWVRGVLLGGRGAGYDVWIRIIGEYYEAVSVLVVLSTTTSQRLGSRLVILTDYVAHFFITFKQMLVPKICHDNFLPHHFRIHHQPSP